MQNKRKKKKQIDAIQYKVRSMSHIVRIELPNNILFALLANIYTIWSSPERKNELEREIEKR